MGQRRIKPVSDFSRENTRERRYTLPRRRTCSAYLEAHALMPPFRLKNFFIDSSSGLVAAAYLNARAHLLRLFWSTCGAVQ